MNDPLPCGGAGGYSCVMTARQRLTRTALIAIFTAAAIGRAELGADTEASVLFTPAFAAALPPALLGGWTVAGQFGRAGLQGWLRALGVTLPVLVLSAVFAALAAPLMGGVAGGPLALLSALPFHPLAWGAALAAPVAVQMVALREAARAQSRK